MSDDPLQPHLLDPEGEEELRGTVVRGVGMAALGFGLAQALTLGFYLALARLATPADFGEFAAASIVVNTSFLLSEGGMLSALIHREGEMEAAANTAVVATALSGSAFALLALASSPLLGHLFQSNRIGELAAAMSGLLLLRNLHIVPQALLQRRFSFLRRVVVEPAQVIAFGAVAIITTANGMGPWGLVLGYYASAVADNLLSWGLARWRPHLRQASMPMWRELIAYGRHILSSHAILRVGEQVPVALLGRFVGAGALGQYRYADRISSTPFAMILAAGAYVLFPAFARIREDRERLRAAFENSLRWLAVIAFPLGLILIPLGPPLAVTVFGSVWRDAGEAAVALAFYPVAATMISITSEVLKADGRPKLLVRIHLVTALCGAAAMVGLLRFDLIGVAAGVSIGAVIGAAYGLSVVRRELDVPQIEVFRALWAPALAATFMVAVVLPIDRLWLQPDTHATVAAVALLAAEGLIGLGVYGGLLAMLRPQLPSELRSMVSAALSHAGRGSLDAPVAPAFTVVIPALNEEDVIASALTSVLRQSRQDWEAIVIDDGSTDGTAERVEPFLGDPRITMMRQANSGLSAARNSGIEIARGRYVTFLDADDLLMPGYLEAMGEALDSSPRSGFAYTDPLAFDSDSGRFRRRTAMARYNPPAPPPPNPTAMLELLVQQNFLFVGATVRRSVLDEVGPFNIDLSSAEDYEMWMRILAAGHGAVNPAGTLAIKRERAGQMTRNAPKMIENLLVVCGAIAADQSLPESVRAAADARLVSLRRWRDGLDGSDRTIATAIRGRAALAAARRAVLWPYLWRRKPPSEVRKAFPDLYRL